MFLFVSDLHWIDESAGEHNLPPRAYEKLLESLNAKNRFEGGRITSVNLVFLGDIFDVVRTTAWCKAVGGASADLRPWGTQAVTMPHNDPAILGKARAILGGILATEKVAGACEVFRRFRRSLEGAGVPVRYHFVPGNHDRFLHADARARAMVCEALALDDYAVDGAGLAAEFPLQVADAEHGVIAFHGHEIDLFNFGRFCWSDHPFAREAFAMPSIGEVITLEIVSQIPPRAATAIEAEFGATRAKEIRSMLQNIDNIRPTKAVFAWLNHLGQIHGRALVTILDHVVAAVFDAFGSIAFTKSWSEAVDQRFIPPSTPWWKRWGARVTDKDFDEYCRDVQSISDAMQLLDVAETNAADSGVDALRAHAFYPQIEAEFERMAAGYGPLPARHIVCGHTHHPEITPVAIYGDTPQVFFDTGTFRPRIVRGRLSGFIEHKTLSYAVIYHPDERSRAGHAQRYEYWQAVLAED